MILLATVKCVGCKKTELRIMTNEQPFCECGNIMLVEKVESHPGD